MMQAAGLWFLLVFLPIVQGEPVRPAVVFGHYDSQMQCDIDKTKVLNMTIQTPALQKQLPMGTTLVCRFMRDQPAI